MSPLEALRWYERSDDSFIAQARLAPVERRPAPIEMTAEEIVEFEAEYVLWNQKIDATPTTPRFVILKVLEIGTVRGRTYREAIGRAKAMLDEMNA